jgi:hypothetical protein
VAIKGKTKRSQGRPVRRVTPGPRAQLVERRVPWYRVPVFSITVAVVVLAITLAAVVMRVQEAWQRDDVSRFSSALEAPMRDLVTLAGIGTKEKPGFASANDLATGKLKATELDRRAQNWATDIGAIREKVGAVSLGEAEVRANADGVPSNQVGGHVRLLSSIRDAYTAAISYYGAAAQTYQYAAKSTGELQKQLLTQAQGLTSAGQQALDAAAGTLATVQARYDLDVTRQMPGESATGYAARYGGAPQPATPAQPSG